MRSISSKVYLFFGLIMIIISFITNKITNSNSMKSLIIIGIIIVIFGILKFALEKAINIGKVKKEYKHTPEYYKKHHTYKYCNKCGSKLRESFNFCYKCGERSA